MSQIVYILTNPHIPNLIKIGMSTRDLEKRVKEINRCTGVPGNFFVHYACEVEDCTKLERALHDAFGEERIDKKKEFFRKDPERVVAILRLFALQELTVENKEIVETAQELVELEKELSKKRENLKLEKLGIKEGDILHFTRDEEITAEVVSDNKIIFRAEIMSLSRAAQLALGVNYRVQGPAYWKYGNWILDELRKNIDNSNSVSIDN